MTRKYMSNMRVFYVNCVGILHFLHIYLRVSILIFHINLHLAIKFPTGRHSWSTTHTSHYFSKYLAAHIIRYIFETDIFHFLLHLQEYCNWKCFPDHLYLILRNKYWSINISLLHYVGNILLLGSHFVSLKLF